MIHDRVTVTVSKVPLVSISFCWTLEINYVDLGPLRQEKRHPLFIYIYIIYIILLDIDRGWSGQGQCLICLDRRPLDCPWLLRYSIPTSPNGLSVPLFLLQSKTWLTEPDRKRSTLRSRNLSKYRQQMTVVSWYWGLLTFSVAVDWSQQNIMVIVGISYTSRTTFFDVNLYLHIFAAFCLHCDFINFQVKRPKIQVALSLSNWKVALNSDSKEKPNGIKDKNIGGLILCSRNTRCQPSTRWADAVSRACGTLLPTFHPQLPGLDETSRNNKTPFCFSGFAVMFFGAQGSLTYIHTQKDSCYWYRCKAQWSSASMETRHCLKNWMLLESWAVAIYEYRKSTLRVTCPRRSDAAIERKVLLHIESKRVPKFASRFVTFFKIPNTVTRLKRCIM